MNSQAKRTLACGVAMTKAQARKRRSEIIRALSDLSRNGWKNARFEDYAPLENELRTLETAR